MNALNKDTTEKAKKPTMSKGARIGGLIAAVIGAILISGPMRHMGLLVEFGVFFVLMLVGMGLGSLFSVGARQE